MLLKIFLKMKRSCICLLYNFNGWGTCSFHSRIFIFFVLFFLVFLSFGENEENIKTEPDPIHLKSSEHKELILSNLYKRKTEIVNLKLSRDDAVKIAEVILVLKFGEHVLRQRPWLISDNDSSYTIEGQKPTNANHWRGGVAQIIISKKNVEVLSISHGR